MIGFNGGLIGKTRETMLASSVPGVWTAREQLEAYRNQKWPGSSPVVLNGLVQYLDAGISTSYPGTGATWTDISTGGNDATLVNGPVFSSAFGGIINFDGGDDRATSTLPALSSFTFNAWVRLDTTAGERRAFTAFNDRFGIAATNVKIFIWNGGPGVIESASTVATNTWYNIAVTSQSGATRMTINNSLEATSTLYQSITSGASVIGAFTSFDRRWDGDIAVVSFYNRVLTTAEITQNYNAEKARFGY